MVMYGVIPVPKMKIDLTEIMPEQPRIYTLDAPINVAEIKITRKEGLELVLEFLPPEK